MRHVDISPPTHPHPRSGFGRLTDFFGRWIRCQRQFPAAVGDDPVLATREPAAVLNEGLADYVDYEQLTAFDFVTGRE